ncbi:DUF1552 domain-containing protein [Anatilimnocola floriformis]|uniref:DUF1552 domain-containing protein n=1 Tax=Anatilimnocola floriformis TaxID=2948575 RepID=UPI0020C56921|nr:DUF1552 domain-containing protein [Anatilimnocola floriformis]
MSEFKATFGVNRRTVLKGLGCTLGLPLLEAMFPSSSFGAPKTKAPVRMGIVFFPNGAIMPAWKPKETGTSYEMPETLTELEAVRKDISIITGLAQDNGRAKGDGPGDHARSAASFLTGAHPFKTTAANIKVGMSVDQAAAMKAGEFTRLPSLEIGIERGRDAGGCDSGYSCAYSNNISWKSESTPMAKEINPRAAFERLFGSKEQTADMAKRNKVRKSILDVVGAQAASLRKDLGQTDQHKIEEFFTSVREIELRIQRAEKQAAQAPPDFKTPESAPSDLREHIRLMYDLLAIAFQTDTTRVATFMLANEGSNRSYRSVGVNSGHHELSHHQNDKEKIDQIKKIDRFLADEFARFVKNLKDIKEGSGSLLDNCMILYSSGLSDGNRHRHDDLPVVLAGRGGGSLKVGQHFDTKREIPMNNLFLSMLDRMDAGITALGDSNGRLTMIDS